MQKFIIAATGTDIGKTEYLCNEIEKNIQKNQSVAALKPILSGYDENNFISSDAGRILKALNQEINIENIHNIAPLRFIAPLAPNQAAKLENRSYNFNDIIKIVDNFINCNTNKNVLYIETAGGIMSPLTDKTTMLDLINYLKWPIILIGGNYLGSISHILTAYNVLKYSNNHIEKIIINKFITTKGVNINSTIEELNIRTSIKCEIFKKL